MKSIFGLALALGVLLAFGVEWRLATRDGASFLDQQWLFLTALPYNVSMITIFGESNFSPDVPGQVVAAVASEAAVAYFVGACAQAGARALWRRVRGANARA